MSQSELQLVYRQQHTEMSCRRLVLTRLCWRQWSLSACGAGLECDSCMTCRHVWHVSRNADDHHWVSWIVNLRQARNSQQHLHWWRRQQTTAGWKCSVWWPQTCSHSDAGHSTENHFQRAAVHWHSRCRAGPVSDVSTLTSSWVSSANWWHDNSRMTRSVHWRTGCVKVVKQMLRTVVNPTLILAQPCWAAGEE